MLKATARSCGPELGRMSKLAYGKALIDGVQEDMYSFVTYSDDQGTKGKGTAIIEA